MMNHWETFIVAMSGAILASSGFWAYLLKRQEKKSATTRLILGLAYERFSFLGIMLIERGHIYQDEYEDILKYLYEPYKELGGNGVAERIMEEIQKLPIHHTPHEPRERNVKNKEIKHEFDK